jgi:hypothetical protein
LIIINMPDKCFMLQRETTAFRNHSVLATVRSSTREAPMLKVAKAQRLAETAPVYAEDIEPALQDALAVLANIDAHYDGERERLELWTGPDSVKNRLAGQLEEAHRQEREPHVKRLAELHQRLMNETFYRHTVH